MFIFKDFLSGLASILSFGWPRHGFKGNNPSRAIEGDWRKVSYDISKAISNYKAENKND